MSLLTIIQSVCGQVGLPEPTVVMSDTGDQMRILRTLANVEGRDLSRRYQWQALVKEALVTTLATESQGEIDTLAPGFKFFLNFTQWNRNTIIPVPNISPQTWQMQKSSNISGPYPQFRVRGGELLFLPVPAAGQTVAFEYVTKNWVESGDGSQTRDKFEQDTDVSILDEFIIEQGIRWRFLKQKNMDYSEEFRTYESLVADAMGRDGGKPLLKAGGKTYSAGINIQIGSWPV